MSDPLIIAGRELHSRLFLGTAGYPNRKLMLDAIAASGTSMVTASVRRISLAGEDESLIDVIPKHIQFLPNTAGCQTAKDAVLTAELAREALGTNWIKLEVIGDREFLYPDIEELLQPASHRADLRTLAGARRARCRDRYGVGRDACDGARVRGGTAQHLRLQSTRSDHDGAQHACGGRSRALGTACGPHSKTAARGALEPAIRAGGHVILRAASATTSSARHRPQAG